MRKKHRAQGTGHRALGTEHRARSTGHRAWGKKIIKKETPPERLSFIINLKSNPQFYKPLRLYASTTQTNTRTSQETRYAVFCQTDLSYQDHNGTCRLNLYLSCLVTIPGRVSIPENIPILPQDLT